MLTSFSLHTLKTPVYLKSRLNMAACSVHYLQDRLYINDDKMGQNTMENIYDGMEGNCFWTT